jgi:hypothetical protein
MGLVGRTGLIFITILSINTIESLTPPLDPCSCEDDRLLLLDSSHDSVSPLFITAYVEAFLGGAILLSVTNREELMGLSKECVLKYPKRLFR